MLKVLDLFSGIGAFSLGLYAAGGFETQAFCETDLFCRSVLSRRWPNIRIHGDIKQTSFIEYTSIDLICGGFPCQDVSRGGSNEGLKGQQSQLWSEYYRAIMEIMPKWIVIENVSLLRTRGLGTILRQLDAIGYVGEWHVIPASAIGGQHNRERLWIIANHSSLGVQRLWPEGHSFARKVAQAILPLRSGDGQWLIEPDFRRSSDGSANRLDRIKSIGNSIIPQIAEIIGTAILRS